MLPSRLNQLSVDTSPRPVRSAPESRRNSLKLDQENCEETAGMTDAAVVLTPRTTSLPNCSNPQNSLHVEGQSTDASQSSGRSAKQAGGFLKYRSSSSPSPCPHYSDSASPSPLRHHSSFESAALARDFFGQQSHELHVPPAHGLLRKSKSDSPRQRMTASPLLRRQSNVRGMMESLVTMPSPCCQPRNPQINVSSSHPASSPRPTRIAQFQNGVPSSSLDLGGGGPGEPPSPSSYFRVVVLGEEGVGKSTLIRQMAGAGTCQHAFKVKDVSTEEEEDSERVVIHVDRRKEHFTLEIFDSPLDANIDTLRPDAFMVVYSMSDRKSYVTAKEVTRHLRCELGMDRPIFLVANKTDLRRQQRVPAREAKDVVEAYDCDFMETSAALRLNVDKVLGKMLDSITEQLLPPEDVILSRDSRLSKPKTFTSGKALKFFSRLFRQALLRRSLSSDSLCLKR